MFKSITRLRQTGTSPAVRKLLVQRLFSQWVYVLAGTFDAWYSYLVITNDSKDNVIIIVAVINIIGTFIRINEPFVWTTFVRMFYWSKP